VLLATLSRAVYCSLSISVLRLGSARLTLALLGTVWRNTAGGEGVYRVMRRPRHTDPSLRLLVPNSLTVHPRSFSLKAVLAAPSFCPATPCSEYSQAVTSSAPFLGLFVSNNSMVQRCITFTLHLHSLLIHPGEAGVSTLPVTPPLLEVSFFRFGGGRPLRKVQFLIISFFKGSLCRRNSVTCTR
jgi:hypothetical protein